MHRTIIRQVDDIERIVDEFSSFSRMPRAQLSQDNLGACIEQVLFLMRVGRPDIEIIEKFSARAADPALRPPAVFAGADQVIKNAAEGIAATDLEGPRRSQGDVARGRRHGDHRRRRQWQGFSAENCARFFEPYMTTRKEGTGLGLPMSPKIFEDHGGASSCSTAAGPARWCASIPGHTRGTTSRRRFARWRKK